MFQQNPCLAPTHPNPNLKPYLTLENISKSFGGFDALRDINLTVAAGEFVCFLGPSGCGKTTLLRIIAGLENQNHGRIIQGGKDISRLAPIKRDYGIVFQSYALFPNLSIADNVAYGLVNRRQSRGAIAERVQELLILAGLPTSGKKFPGQLSGGQQQRIALVRALATSPGLLLLDEPLSALDALERVRLRSEIRLLQQRLGVTTIMVTHDQEEALTMADRIVVMNHGAIEQCGSPQDIYLQPDSPFVASFVGKVNILRGVSLGDGRFRIGKLDFHCESRIDRIPAGQPVKVYLRPEDFVARSVEQRTQNHALAEVKKIEFLGAFSYLTVVLEGMEQQPVVASMSLNLLKELALTVGSKLRYGLLPERIRVYQDNEPCQDLAVTA
jgi:iron(III) transport system ATP-binding protein